MDGKRFVEDNFWNSCFNALDREGASELVANGPGEFFVTYKGKKQKINSPAMSERSYLQSIEKYLVPFVASSYPFDPQGYLFEGRYILPGGFEGRCHIMLPPATDTPRVTLTKIAGTTTTVEQIAESGSMSTEMFQFLIAAVKAKCTIVLSGQSGAGKTTTLQALAKHFDPQDRVGVGEDIPELRLPQPNVFYLHSVPWKPNFDPNSVADLSWVVKQFLRMRPDRTVIGETRGKEFADFLTAANSGMEGSMTTIHANDPSGALDKMTQFALEGGAAGQPVRSINKMIGSAVDLVLQLERINGEYRMTQIEEIYDVVNSDDTAKLTTSTLYKYNRETGNWIKDSQMSDKLKLRFAAASIPIKPFIATQIGSEMRPHSSAALRRSEEPNLGGSFSGSNPFSSKDRRAI